MTKAVASDYYAYLGIPLDASDVEIRTAYRRAVRLLNPDRFRPGDRRALQVSKIFENQILNAYSQLRPVALRTAFLEDFRAGALQACRLVPRTAVINRLQTAGSPDHLRTLYRQEIASACEELHLDVNKFEDQTRFLHHLNLAFVGLSKVAPWQLTAPVQSCGLQRPTEWAERQLLFAKTLLQNGYVARAIQILRPLRVPAPYLAIRHELLGHCYRLTGTSTLAAQEFRAALQIEPQRHGALSGLKRLGIIVT